MWHSGPSEIAPGERIHGLEAQPESVGVMLGGEHGKYTNPVSNEIRGVLARTTPYPKVETRNSSR
ncbi:MAG: hypothetical protein WDM70_10790 [Nitrosomonadales bacterium]